MRFRTSYENQVRNLYPGCRFIIAESIFQRLSLLIGYIHNLVRNLKPGYDRRSEELGYLDPGGQF